MNQNKQHMPGCLANIQCLAIHIEGECPGPYGVCTCSCIPDNTQRGGSNPFNLGSPTPDGYKVVGMNTNEPQDKEKYSNIRGMKKIIQIAISNDDTLCLTEDGKVYTRRLKNEKRIEEKPSDKYPHGRIYITGTYYWEEVPEEDSF